MMDEPPPDISSAFELSATEADQLDAETDSQSYVQDDGTLVIDLTLPANSLEPCETDQPDPLNPAIVVCGDREENPRLELREQAEVDEFGNAIPRAQIRLSEDAEAEANAINKGVGGWNGNGGEVRVKIDF